MILKLTIMIKFTQESELLSKRGKLKLKFLFPLL